MIISYEVYDYLDLIKGGLSLTEITPINQGEYTLPWGIFWGELIEEPII